MPRSISHGKTLLGDQHTRQQRNRRQKQRLGTLPLRILQWNGEGLNIKMDELKEFLVNYKIDIYQVDKKKKHLIHQGIHITLIHADRTNADFPGGGLITYVKEDIAFKLIGHCNKGPVEILSTAIQQSAKNGGQST